MVQVIAAAMGANVEIEVEDVRVRPEKSEVDRLWADNRKARDMFGWSPAYGGREGFARGIGETVAWFADAGNLALYKPGAYGI